MDRFDRIGIIAICVLAIAAFFVMQADRGEDKRDPLAQQREAVQERTISTPELEKQINVIRNLLDAGNPAEAEPLAKAVVQQYPFQAEPQMLLGDVLMQMQDPIQAMHAYKKAIGYNPDYLDRKTPQFQGKKLKNAVGEALTEIESRLKQHPGDENLNREKKTVYYLYRKIAGSCG